MHGSNNTFSGFVILLPTSCTEEKALALEDKTNYLILAKVLTHHACIKTKPSVLDSWVVLKKKTYCRHER